MFLQFYTVICFKPSHETNKMKCQDRLNSNTNSPLDHRAIDSQVKAKSIMEILIKYAIICTHEQEGPGGHTGKEAVSEDSIKAQEFRHMYQLKYAT